MEVLPFAFLTGLQTLLESSHGHQRLRRLEVVVDHLLSKTRQGGLLDNKVVEVTEVVLQLFERLDESADLLGVVQRAEELEEITELLGFDA